VRVRKSLDVAILVLNIMTNPGISRRLIIEDVIDKLVRFVKVAIMQFIIPIYDPTFRASTADTDDNDDKASPKKKAKGKTKAEKEKKVAKKNKKSEADEKKHWKSMSKTLAFVHSKMCGIMDRAAMLFRVERMTDSHVLPTIEASFAVLRVESLLSLHMAGINLLTAIFLHYPDSRYYVASNPFLWSFLTYNGVCFGMVYSENILDDVITQIAAADPKRKCARHYPLLYGPSCGSGSGVGLDLALDAPAPSTTSTSATTSTTVTTAPTTPSAVTTTVTPAGGATHIQMISALALQLIQCIPSNAINDRSVAVDVLTDIKEDKSQTKIKKAKDAADVASNATFADQVVNSYTESRNMAVYLVRNLLKVLSPAPTVESAKGHISSVKSRALISRLVEDILAVLFLPEWPAAELVLHLLMRVFGQFQNDENAAKDKVQMLVRQMSLELGGVITAEIKYHSVQAQRHPLTLPSRRINVNTEATPQSQGEDAKCICGGNLPPGANRADKFMLDCDDCHGNTTRCSISFFWFTG
jgi:hypothetical protein